MLRLFIIILTSFLFIQPSFAQEEDNELQYLVAVAYLNEGSYNKAYNVARNVTGELKNKALKIQAQCVAATANSCGDSTFERKCNYVYAAQLMEQAGLDGSKYRALGPNPDSLPYGGSPKNNEVTLKCWGVKVNIGE